MRNFLAILFLLSPACLASEQFKELSAEYDIGGATIIDAPASEPKNSHIYFRIKEDAAKAMYEMIESEPVRDECLDDGTLTKWANNIQCSFNPVDNSYICYFSIGVNSNAVGPGVAC